MPFTNETGVAIQKPILSLSGTCAPLLWDVFPTFLALLECGGRNRATHARLTVSKSLISLGISTKITYPDLTSFNPVTEGFTENFTEGIWSFEHGHLGGFPMNRWGLILSLCIGPAQSGQPQQ